MRAASAVIAALAVVLAAPIEGVRGEARPVPDGMQTFEQFHATIAQYPYVAPGKRAAKIRSGATRLTRCLAKAEIQVLLGDPDFGSVNYGPKGPKMKWLGSSWSYYLSKRDSGANIYDPGVEVFFDTADRAHWIVVTGIPGVKDVGSVGDKCT